MGRRVRNPDDPALVRISLHLDPSVKQWYVDVANSYGMPFSSYMQYILITHMNAVKNQEAVRALSDVSQSEDYQDTQKAIAELVAFMREERDKEEKAAEKPVKPDKK